MIRNVLSLFDGISCGQMAMHDIPFGRYYASEIDNQAVMQTRQNFPDTVVLGDVTRWREWDVPWDEIDLLIGGSPCQGFSNANDKRKRFKDPRSDLFYVYVDILKFIRARNPNVKFLFENVASMDEMDMLHMSGALGVRAQKISSDLFSAQGRIRYYWSNIRTRSSLLGMPETNFTLPDRPNRVVLGHILDSRVPDSLTVTRSEPLMQYANYVQYKDSQYYRFWRVTGKHGTLCAYGKDVTGVYVNGVTRRLTTDEVCRLQTIPETYRWYVSPSKIYEQVGNGWTVDLINYLLKQML